MQYDHVNLRPPRNLSNPRLIPTFIAVFFGGAVFLRGVVLLALAGANWTSDSQGFVLFGRLLRDFSFSMPLYLRSPPYLIINAITLSDLSLAPILLFQAALAGFAVGFLVYAVGISSKFAGVLIGFALLCDIVSATSQRLVLVEGPLSSFQLIALALLTLHFAKPTRSLTLLFWSGVLYCWCLLFRQSNLPLLLPILLFYAYRYRSFRHAGAVGLGMLSLIVALNSFNYIRTGEWRLWSQGGWYAEFPMFNLGMFSSENGPASKRIAENIIRCGISKAPSSLRLITEGGVSQGAFEACLTSQELARLENANEWKATESTGSQGLSTGRSSTENLQGTSDRYYEKWYSNIKLAYSSRDWAFEDRVASLISTAYYREALPNNLDKVPEILWNEFPRFLAGRTYTLPGQLWLFPQWSKEAPDHICPFDWCDRQHFPSSYPFDGTLILQVQEVAKWPTQLYLALSQKLFQGESTDLKIFGVFMLFSFIILTVKSGAPRFLGLIVIFAIFYNVLITTLANVYILRYTSPLSSLYAIHSALTVYSVIFLARSIFFGRWMNGLDKAKRVA